MSINSVVKSSGVVCFLDLLGAKGGWRDAENMISLWDELFDQLNGLSTYLETEYSTKPTSYSFSDSIVITAPFNKADKKEVFYNLSGLIAFMFSKFVTNRLLLRGCISVGDYYTSKARRMLIGPAIDEAVQYHALAEWCGVSLCPSAHLFADENPLPDFWAVINYPIPLKGIIENDGIALKWVDGQDPDEVRTIRGVLVDKLKNSTDVTASLKLRNTINFIDYVVSKEAKPSSDVLSNVEKAL